MTDKNMVRELELNEYQTPVNVDFFENEAKKRGYTTCPDEIIQQFYDFYNTVPNINWFCSKDRPRAKDLPRDKKGRIIVDIAHPHILEDMDYFRQAGIHYEKYGCYTFLKPNKNKQSEFYKWLQRERHRIWYGMLRKSDGEWITGDTYYFLNYSPIMKTRVIEGTNSADRVEGFPDIWDAIYLRGHYLYQAKVGGMYNDFKGGNHCAELARRGAGKSYYMASKMSRNITVGDNARAKKRLTTTLVAATKEAIAGKDGTLSKFEPIFDFTAAHTELGGRLRIKSSMNDMFWQTGYKVNGEADIKGDLNIVSGLSIAKDVSKVRGKRGFIMFEEFGSFPNLLTVYSNVRKGCEEGDSVYGQIYCIGTAGDKESDFSSAQELVYHPDGYNIYALPNVWDKAASGRSKFAYFFPAYLGRKGCVDKNGNSDVTKALLQILFARYKAKYETSDPMTIVKETAEMPITPQEAIVRTAYNMFPANDAAQQLSYMDNDATFFNKHYTGQLTLQNGVASFVPGQDPIRFFPHKNNKIEGAIEFFELPVPNPQPERYIAGCDPYDNDEAETMSLGSIFVLDTWTDRLVCEYTGRPKYADDFYEICRRICIFYHCRVNYENNKKGLFSYFSRMSSSHLIIDTPENVIQNCNIKPANGNSKKGTPATQGVNQWARKLLRDWLILNETDVKQDDEKHSEEVILTQKVYTVRSRALLQEIISYNTIGNFDRISSMGMLMIYRDDVLRRNGGDLKLQSTRKSSEQELADDEFIKGNFDDRFGKDNSALSYVPDV